MFSASSGLRRLQGQADRVDAVTLVGRRAVPLALEHVAEVGAAVGAAHLGANAPEGPVLDVLDPVLGERCEEGRPAAVGVELGVRAEQLGVAGPAAVDAFGLGVGVLAGERPLGAGLAQDGVLLPAQLLVPLGVGLLDWVCHGRNGSRRARASPVTQMTNE